MGGDQLSGGFLSVFKLLVMLTQEVGSEISAIGGLFFFFQAAKHL